MVAIFLVFLVLVAMGVAPAVIVIVITVVVAQFVAERAAGCATQARAYGRTGAAADLAAEHRTARSAEATAPGANRRAGATADLLADDVAQDTANAAADGDFAGVAGQGIRRGDKAAERERCENIAHGLSPAEEGGRAYCSHD